MRANPELSPKEITIGMAKQLLAEGHFFLPTKMELMFRDWNFITDTERQSRANFLRSTSTSETSYEALANERRDQQDILITNNQGKSISVIARARDMYPQIFISSNQSMAQSLETDALNDALELIMPPNQNPNLLPDDDADTAAFFSSQGTIAEKERKINRLFLSFSMAQLAKKYPKGSPEYLEVENKLISQLTSNEETRKTFHNEIWEGIDLEKCYSVAEDLIEQPLLELNEKIQKFQTTNLKVFQTLERLRDRLSQNITNYTDGSTTTEDFYNQCSEDIESARITLEKHRGCAGIFSGLTRALSNFAALFGFRTDSAKKLDALKEELAALTGHPSPEAQRTEEFFERLDNFDMEEDLSSRGPGRRT